MRIYSKQSAYYAICKFCSFYNSFNIIESCDSWDNSQTSFSNLRDQRGRTVLHLIVLSVIGPNKDNPQTILSSIKNITRQMLHAAHLKTNEEQCKDHMDRTPLHYCTIKTRDLDYSFLDDERLFGVCQLMKHTK